jgi:hypothetical protein
VRWIVAVLIACDLIAAGAIVSVHSRDRAVAFSAEQAVERFRTHDAGAPPPDEAAVGAAAETTDAPAPPPPDTSAPTVGAAPTSSAPRDVAPEPTPGPAPTTTAAPAAASGAVPPFPDEGVYVYDTTGYEAIDALGGSRHDYPRETTIVFQRSGCGVTETWQPLEDRRDVRQLCPAPGRHRLETYDSSRSFFGRSDSRRLSCEDSASAFVAAAEPGDVFEFHCVDGTTDAANRVEILGIETVAVGGRTVEAIRSRAVTDVTGDSQARSTIESWLHRQTGLTLKRVATLDGRSPGPGGDVGYHEEYTLVLRSLDPRR